ncbi:MAG: hypothetical protein ACI9HK_004488, partial [Pirellulaceae bacterium]
ESAHVLIVVSSVNDAPHAEDDSATGLLAETIAIDVLRNDADVDGDSLLVTNLGTPQSGTVALNNVQTVVYTPNPGFAGEDAFTYTISDGAGLTDSAIVTVVVSDSFDVRFQQDVDGYAGTVDTFIQGAAGDANNSAAPQLNVDGSNGGLPVQALLQFNEIFGDANGQVPVGAEITSATLVLQVTNPGAAISLHRMIDLWLATDTWNSLGDGVQTDGVEAVGDADVVTGTVGTGSFAIDVTSSLAVWSSAPDSNRGWAIIPTGANGEDFFSAEGEVPPVLEVSYRIVDNTAPVAFHDQASTAEDTLVRVNVLANDVDADGDSLTIVEISDPANGHAEVVGDVVVYMPNDNFNGVDNFTYAIEDAHGARATATVTVFVAPVNDAPIAERDEASVDEDTSVTISVLDNDVDVDGDTLTVTTATQGNKGSLVVNNDGTVTYTPNADATGEDVIIYTIIDGNGGSDVGELELLIRAVNDAPEAVSDRATTESGVPVDIHVLANDVDIDGDSLVVTGVSNGNGGPVSINNDGTVTYSPQPGFTGEDLFTYTISDGHGGADTAEIIVNVTGGINNTPPVAIDDVATLVSSDSVLIDVLGNDIDADGDALVIVSLTQPAGGQVDILDGQVIFVPDAEFTGQTTFEYTVGDGHGGTDSALVTVDVFEIDVAVFQQGLDGYEGTVDTYIRGARANRSYGEVASLNVDGRSGRQPVQTLIRFEEIFGGGEGQIPEGAVILSARLDLRISNSGNPISVHRMVSTWDDTITWNAASGGIQADGNEAEVEADVVTDRLRRGLRGIDVTASLHAWADDPASNLGWAFLPTGNNGVDFDSSEGLWAPRLIVEFAIPAVAGVDPGGNDGGGDGAGGGDGNENPGEDPAGAGDVLWDWNDHELGNRIVLERVNNRMELDTAVENDWTVLVDEIFGQLNAEF